MDLGAAGAPTLVLEALVRRLVGGLCGSLALAAPQKSGCGEKAVGVKLADRAGRRLLKVCQRAHGREGAALGAGVVIDWHGVGVLKSAGVQKVCQIT